jgi:hypothetical protein
MCNSSANTSFVSLIIDLLSNNSKTLEASRKRHNDQLIGQLYNLLCSLGNSTNKHLNIENDNFFPLRYSGNFVIINVPINDDSNIIFEFENFISQFGLFQLNFVAEACSYIGGELNIKNSCTYNEVPKVLALDKEQHSDIRNNYLPRMILTESTISVIMKYIFPMQLRECSPYYRYLLQDEDGTVFINYLESSCYQFGEPAEFELIEKHYDNTISMLRLLSESDSLRREFKWLAQYHNFWCDDKNLNAFKIDGVRPLKVRRLDNFKYINPIFN